MVRISIMPIKEALQSLKIKEVLGVIGLLIFSRIIPHWPNFTALGATAILAPLWLSHSRLSLIVPVLALFISDLVIGFYPAMALTYIPVFLVSVLSWRSKKKNLSGGFDLLKWGVGSSFVFFLFSNLGSWLVLDIYQKNLSGLILSYWNGIPFMFNDFLGTIVYLTAALYLRKRVGAFWSHSDQRLHQR